MRLVPTARGNKFPQATRLVIGQQPKVPQPHPCYVHYSKRVHTIHVFYGAVKARKTLTLLSIDKSLPEEVKYSSEFIMVIRVQCPRTQKSSRNRQAHCQREQAARCD